MKTQSEKLFEDCCANAGLACTRISEEASRTPDYELTIDGQRIVVEVKEFSRNKDEQESDRLLSERGYGSVLSNTPGDRVRKKITDSSAQIKARTQGTYPSILVLFDRGQIAGHLDPYNIRVAMYGLEQIHIAVPRVPSVSPYATGMSYGPKRKMTEEDNTSISAIGVLFTPGLSKIGLHVYHNRYAAVPLDSTLLARHGIRQYELEGDLSANTAKWKELVIQHERTSPEVVDTLN
jgi:hypothetical protein